MDTITPVMHTDPLVALGAAVGLIGVSIAIWLQMVAKRRSPVRYVVAFYLFGSIFILMNTGAFGVSRPATDLFMVLGLLVAIVVELGGAVYVYRNYSTPRVTSTDVAEWLDERLDMGE